MAKFIVHKKGFFYTDEAYESSDELRGSIIDAFDTIEEARAMRKKQDALIIQDSGGMCATDFFFYNKNYINIFEKFKKYYADNFNIKLEDDIAFSFPEEISEVHAHNFLEILDTSFHDIVVYADDDVIDPKDFSLEGTEYEEF